MDHRIINIIITSATGLKKSTFNSKRELYAVASISGQKLRTNTTTQISDSDSDPTWNFPMKFTVDETAGLQNRLTLVVKIKKVGLIGDKKLGEVRIPVKELLEGGNNIGDKNGMRSVCYQVRRPSGKPKGVLNLNYEVGEKVPAPVTAYAQRQQHRGYGYSNPYPKPAGYGYYPPAQVVQGYGGYPPATVVQPRRSGMGGMGFGTGLMGGALGGLLIGDMMAHSGGCGGGGCGSGGCGGGCGGGGCGGF